MEAHNETDQQLWLQQQQPEQRPPPQQGSSTNPACGGTKGSSTEATCAAASSKLIEALEHEVIPSELSKWSEMIDMGIPQYMKLHPDRFHRRVRRGIPQRFRWQVWKAAVQLNECERLPQLGDYPTLSQRENAWTPLIEIDISQTFPELRSFDSNWHQRLLRVLNAYAAFNPCVGYCNGMNFVAGLLLLVSNSEEESLAVLTCLMDSPHFGLSGFYREKLPLLRRYIRAGDKLVAEVVPELREHFMKENVPPDVYLTQWFLPLFINCFHLSIALIIWDDIICEGPPVILRIAVSMLQVLKDTLLSMHFEEIINFFKMMKTYDNEELNPHRIGQLLMKHTEHVQIPDRTLQYLSCELREDDESWEADLSGGGEPRCPTRMFTSGSTQHHAAVAAPELASTTPPRSASPQGMSQAQPLEMSSMPELASTIPPRSASPQGMSQAHALEMSSSVSHGGPASSGGQAPMSLNSQPHQLTAEEVAGSSDPTDGTLTAASDGGGAACGGGDAAEAEDENLTRDWQFL